MYKLLNKETEIITVINENLHNLPFVISIPHSGQYITKEMNSKLNDVILANMDWYLPELYNFLEELDFTVIVNNISRYLIDTNRDINAEDSEEYTKSLIYKKTTFNKEIYKTSLLKEEIKGRINNYYKKYHEILIKLILDKQRYFKKVYLIDLHSFGKQVGADVVLGDNNGKTINNGLINHIKKLFEDNGFHTEINNPFKGGYITKHYGANGKRCESLQIELSYSSYIDKRVFGEEEYPHINRSIMVDCQKRLKKIFVEIGKIN